MQKFKEFLLAQGLSENTAIAYVSNCKIIENHFGKRRDAFGSLTVAEIDDYLANLKSSEATIQMRLDSVKKYFVFLNQSIGTEIPVFSHVRRPKQPPSPAFLKKNEIAHLMQHINSEKGKEAARARCIVYLLYYTGMRPCELASLTINSFNFKNESVLVTGKSKQSRIIPLNRKVIPYIQEWLSIRSSLPTVSESLFISFGKNTNGEPLGLSSLRHIVKEIFKDCGLGEYNPYKLRHSFATHLLRKGVDLTQISHLLGHRCIASTMSYVSTSNGLYKQAVNAL